MKKTTLLLTICTFFYMNAALAQGVCGMSAADQDTEDFHEATKMVNEGFVQFRSVVKYVPIKFNLIGTTEGESFLKRSNALDQLWKLNLDYNDQEFHFYLDEDTADTPDSVLFNFVSNSVAFRDPRAPVARILFENARERDAMNLYIVENIPPSDNTQGTILGYNDRNNDWVVQLKNETTSTSSTMSHEGGHFFSLNHPHFGWEGDPFGDEGDELFTPASTISPGGSPTEYADGRNCTTSADNLCDTPSDYNGLTFPCDPFTDDMIQDPDGVGIRPMVNNTMSYFGSCAQYEFTPDQKNQIIANYESNRRNYLRPGLAPEFGEITEKATQIAPIDTVEMMNGEPVTLTWNAVPNAKYYLVNMGRCNATGACATSFGTGFQQYITTETEYTVPVEDLQNNRRFYWNVRPFNTHYADPAVTSDIELFRTTTISAVNEIEGLNQFSISPNPIRDETSFSLNLDTDQSLSKAKLTVRDISGKNIYEQLIGNINSGQNKFVIDVPNLANGVYAITLATDQGIRTTKLAKIN